MSDCAVFKWLGTIGLVLTLPIWILPYALYQLVKGLHEELWG